MTIASNLMTWFIAILVMMTVAAGAMGVIQPQRRTLFWIFAGMFGFMAALTAIVVFLILRTLPQ